MFYIHDRINNGQQHSSSNSVTISGGITIYQDDIPPIDTIKWFEGHSRENVNCLTHYKNFITIETLRDIFENQVRIHHPTPSSLK